LLPVPATRGDKRQRGSAWREAAQSRRENRASHAWMACPHPPHGEETVGRSRHEKRVGGHRRKAPELRRVTGCASQELRSCRGRLWTTAASRGGGLCDPRHPAVRRAPLGALRRARRAVGARARVTAPGAEHAPGSTPSRPPPWTKGQRGCMGLGRAAARRTVPAPWVPGTRWACGRAQAPPVTAPWGSRDGWRRYYCPSGYGLSCSDTPRVLIHASACLSSLPHQKMPSALPQ